MTTIEYKRIRLVVLDPQHAADNDLVIAARINVLPAALEACSKIRK